VLQIHVLFLIYMIMVIIIIIIIFATTTTIIFSPCLNACWLRG